MPFVADPRYSNSDRQFKTQHRIKEDQSTTHRAPYPQDHEIGLPRVRMNNN